MAPVLASATDSRKSHWDTPHTAHRTPHDKQQQGQFVWQEGLLFNTMPITALTIQPAAVLYPSYK